jgi:diguanylate cyclase (GGDEF)-like protein
VQLLGLWTMVTLIAVGVRYLQDVSPRWGNLATQMALIMATVIGYLVTRHHRQRDWVAPMARLRQAYADVRDRNAPIDELDHTGGQLQPAADLLAATLRELRSQRANVAALNDELRQRVAQRTELLERRIGSLKRQSNTDQLTGLQNRRRLEEMMPQEVERCRLSGVDLSVLMVDIDYFKQLNDLRGHATGDEFLRSVGQLIRSSIRDVDEAFRVGGDEFVVVLPGSTPAAADALAARLVSLTESLARTYKVPLPPKLSIGASSLSTATDPTHPGLLATADKALYAIKSSRPVHSRAS